MASPFREGDVAVEFLKGSGPGGQRRNKRETGVRLTHLPTGLSVMATEMRSQANNLAIAWIRLEERVRRFLTPRKPRKKTRIPASARAERLRRKKARSATKRLRKPVSGTQY
jgi:protein subunit release factor B